MTAERGEGERRRIRSLFHAFCNSKRPRRHIPAIAAVARNHRPLARFIGHFLREWPDYHTFRKVPGCPRTSNGVENGIGSLEGHLGRLKGFRSAERADGFLTLWALHANFRPFETGPYRGRCPLELAGLDVKGRDWLDWTGLAD